MLDEKSVHDMAGETFAAFGDGLQQAHGAIPQMVAALDFNLTKPKQIVIAGNPEAHDTLSTLRVVQEHLLPDQLVLLADIAEGRAFLGKPLEFFRETKPVDGKATAFVCENCQLPTTNLDGLARLLSRKIVE